MTDWQPIETAPKYTYVLLYCGGDVVYCGMWRDLYLGVPGRWYVHASADSRMYSAEPTHWVPFPVHPNKV